MNALIDLDGVQRRVVDARPEARQMVLAGPGSGKTEVVVRLVDRLVADGLYPDEILVISFSRAAVDVVRRRAGGMVGDSGHLTVRTVDSLARQVLRDEPDDDARYLSFDDTVRRATELLQGATPASLGDVRHIIVDEVQDLVGVRARFVLTLLNVLVHEGAGFTLLGDPIQALYDFQLGSDPLTCTAFLSEIRTRHDPVEHTLTGEYRARSTDSRVAAGARAELAVLEPDAQHARLMSLAADISPMGRFDQDAVDDISAWRGRTALLCDTNIRAAIVASRACQLGLPVEVQSGSADHSLPAWVGMLLQDCQTPVLSREQFLQLPHDCDDDRTISRWRVLMQVSRSRRDLDLGALAAVLECGSVDRTMVRSPSTPVTASTVHRSKGLEFDNVVLVDLDSWNRDEASSASRTMFVALSRSRSRLTRVHGIDTTNWSKERSRGGTSLWVRRPPRRGRRANPTELLIEPWMVRGLGPVWDCIPDAVGAGVTWDRAPDLITVDGTELPSWYARAGDKAVARTGEQFGAVIGSIFPGRSSWMPSLHGGRVEGLETVVRSSRRDGHGRHRFWVSARVAGPVSFRWDERDSR